MKHINSNIGTEVHLSKMSQMYNMDLQRICLLCIVFFTPTTQSLALASQSSSLQIPRTNYSLLCWLPAPMKSHQILFHPLIRELATRGHHITFVTPMPMSDPPPNLEQIIIKDQSDLLFNLIKMQGFLDKVIQSRVAAGLLNYTESIFLDQAVIDFLNSDRHFDGIFMELIMNEVFIGLHHKYQAPVIDVMPLPHFHWSYFLHGIPYDTSYIVESTLPFTDRMSFLERLVNTAVSLLFRFLMDFYLIPSYQEIMDKHLRYPGWEARSNMKQLIKNTSLVLINTHFSVSYSYPLPPHAKEIAGINMPPSKPLPKDLQSFMDSGKDGIIIFSLGSHISMEKTLGAEKTEVFRQFFGSLKQKVLWKTDSNITQLPENVRLTKWFPQMDILGHPNTRLFISHCGYHSSIETIFHRVPVVATPVQADQMKNAKMLTYYNMAITLSLDNITVQSLSWAVEEVMTNTKFKENAMKRSKIFRDQKESPIETAVYWIEYVLRHQGAHHLKSAVSYMPWYQVALLDVYTTLFVIILIPVIIIYCIVKCTWSRLLRKKRTNIVNKKKSS